MMQYQNSFNDVNTLEGLRNLDNDILFYLVDNNEEIWKLLKYPINNALFQDNLTSQEKKDLIYKGTGETDRSKYRAFVEDFSDDAATDEHAELHISTEAIKPTNSQIAEILVKFEIPSNVKIATIIDINGKLANRNEIMVQQIIKTLNGRVFDGITPLAFVIDNSTHTRDYAIAEKFNPHFKGFKLFMSCKVSS